MKSERSTPPFSFARKQQEANAEFTSIVSERVEVVRNKFISANNVMKLSHGSGWKSDYPHSHDNEGEFKTFSSDTGMKFQDVVDHDVSILRKNIDKLAADLSAQFQRNLFAMISESTDRSGNTVSASDHSSDVEAVLAMLEKIEFGVDENGQASLPMMVMQSNGSIEKMIEQLESAGSDYKERFEAVKQRKIAKALAEEADRKSKFLTQDIPS
jgi:hypothetical protein